jgi:uncharacterized membrane protein
MATTTTPWNNYLSEARTAPARGPSQVINVGQGERLASLVAGGLLALEGLSRGRLSGLLLTAFGASLLYRGASGHCHLYDALGMNSATTSPLASIPAQQGFKVEETMTISKAPEELYAYWRDFQNLPRIMPDLVSVSDQGQGRSHWVAKGPFGNVEWDAEIINERANEMIAWRSVEGSEVDTAGSVHFKPAPGGRGTEVHVSLKYNPPAGKIGGTVAWLMGRDPQHEVRESLRAFKRTMETGVHVTTEGQPQGRWPRRALRGQA